MYAIIELGSKQYNVKEKDVIETEELHHKVGKDFEVKKVLMVKDGKSVHIGQPYVKDYKVMAKVIRQLRGPKVISYKYIRRENVRWKKGHRQNLNSIQITDISAQKVAEK